MQSVNPSHGGWASVWHKLWLDADYVGRGRLIEYADRWLKDVNARHSRWPFIWRTLWDVANEPQRRAELVIIARSWLENAIVISYATNWALVWQALWDLEPRDGGARTHLAALARNWLERGDIARGSWVGVWTRLWETHNQENREGLLTQAYNWLEKSDPNRTSWPTVWRLLWDSSTSDLIQRNHLMVQAEQWLTRTKPHVKLWPDVWETVWDSSANDHNHLIIGMVLECKLIDGLSTCIQTIVDGDAFGRCFGMMRLTIVYVGRI